VKYYFKFKTIFSKFTFYYIKISFCIRLCLC